MQIIKIVFLIGLSLSVYGNSLSPDFIEIDQHADNAPQQLKGSIPALVYFLIQPTQNDIQKVRAIYRWISQNVDYDVDSYFERRLISDDPQQVINSGYAVCGGYARLFKRMCREVNIPCEIITGWSKGYSETLSADPNHAWNAVQIDQKWHLLDVTWGSGYINEQQTYSKSFQEHYFFTDPRLMIYDHLPENEIWQLLDTPVSRKEFEESILLRPNFFKTGLSLLSHKESRIKVSEELIIKIAAPPSTSLNGELIRGNQVLADHYVLSQRQNDIYYTYVHFPAEGDYLLRIYSKIDDEQELYHWACDYNIHVIENVNDQPFAKQFSSFFNLNGFLYYPLDLFLESAENQKFKITLDNALEVALLVNEKKLIPMQKSNDTYTASVKPAAGPLRIMAKTDTTNQYQFLLEYQVK